MLKKISIFIFISSLFLFGFNDNIINNINLNIENRDDYLISKNQFIQPIKGNKYIGFLISISNNSNLVLYGGTCGYNNTFEILTADNYIIKADNIGCALKDNSKIEWCVNDIPPGETRRGWIFFSIPENTYVKNLIFNADEIIGPQRIRTIGKIKIDVR
jgi:hypothetical protein